MKVVPAGVLRGTTPFNWLMISPPKCPALTAVTSDPLLLGLATGVLGMEIDTYRGVPSPIVAGRLVMELDVAIGRS